jgi:hypothetical protein
MQTYQDHPYATVLRAWKYDKDSANELIYDYLATQRTLSTRELELLVLLDLGSVMRTLTRWYGTRLAVAARAHLVHEIKTNQRLVG